MQSTLERYGTKAVGVYSKALFKSGMSDVPYIGCPVQQLPREAILESWGQ